MRLIGPITISFAGASNRPRPKIAARGSCESAEHFVLRRCLNQIDPARFQPMDLIERFKTLCDLQAYPSYSQLDSVKCHRYAPPVHMIRLSEEREITPSVWVHLDEER